MKIYNIVNIPRGLSEEFVCDCQEEYNSGYTAGEEDGFGKGYDSGFTDGVESVDCTDFYNSGVTDGFNSGYTSGTTDGYDSGVTAGEEIQKSKLTTLTVLENGVYSREDGYNEVNVQVPAASGAGYDSGFTDGYESGYTDGSEDGFDSGWTGGYDSGVTDGEEAQKAKMIPLKLDITQNNTHYSGSRADGYNSFSLHIIVPSGDTINNQDKQVDITGGTFVPVEGWLDYRGYYWADTFITPDEGYTGLGTVSALTSFNAEDAISYGEGLQKKKLTGLTVSDNGTYTREDGWSAVTVEVDTDSYYRRGYDSGFTDGFDSGWTGGYDSGITDGWQPAYDSGYTDGLNAQGGDYASGYTDGVAAQKAKLSFKAITGNGFYTRTDGWSAVSVNVDTSAAYQEGYDSGFTDGAASVDCTDFYNSGITDGENIQKAKLSSTTITQNGTYTRANGWSAVTVNVPQTGYTQQDLDNAYASGWSGGYDSGYTDGQEDCSGSTAATAMTVSVPQGMIPGETGNTTVSTRPANVPTNLSYSSSDANVATIDNNGVITTVNSGTTNICVVDSISQLTSCTQLNVAVPASGNADVTLYIRNSGSSSEEINLCASAFILTLEEMRVDGATVTPASSMTLSPGMHVIEFNVRSNYHKVIQQAFWQNSAYAAVVSPRSVHPSFELEYGAFMRSNITSVSLNEGVTTVSASTFAYCYNLTGVSLPQSCTGIVAPSLCLGDTNLQSVNYGSGITKIGDNAFSGCTSLTSVTIPNTITYIGTNAYRTCTGITSVDIGNGITGMGVNVFEDCTSLTSVTFGNNLGGTIPGYMFRNCTALTDCILPVGITAIGQEAFKNTALSEIVIPEGVMTIGMDAFRSGDYVTAVTLPETITEIGQGAFADLVLNTRITIYAGSPPTLGATSGVNASFGTPGATIYVPAGSLFIYKDAWPVYADYMQGFV